MDKLTIDQLRNHAINHNLTLAEQERVAFVQGDSDLHKLLTKIIDLEANVNELLEKVSQLEFAKESYYNNEYAYAKLQAEMSELEQENQRLKETIQMLTVHHE